MNGVIIVEGFKTQKFECLSQLRFTCMVYLDIWYISIHNVTVKPKYLHACRLRENCGYF